MKKFIVMFMAGMLVVGGLRAFAQDTEEPEPDPEVPVPEEPQVEEPEAEEPEVELNASQQEKAERLSEASGVSVEEILKLRSGTRLEQPEGEVPEGEAPEVELPEGELPEGELPQGRGWGVIAKFLGLHPGVLGKGTGDKFYPKDEEGSEDGLPELPEVTAEADEAVKGAREKTRAENRRKVKEHKELAGKAGDKRKAASSQRDKARVASDRKSAKEHSKPEKVKREKPAKPDRGAKAKL